MIDDFDDLPPAAIVAMKFVAGSKNWARKRAGGNGSTPAKLSSCSFTLNFQVQFEGEV